MAIQAIGKNDKFIQKTISGGSSTKNGFPQVGSSSGAEGIAGQISVDYGKLLREAIQNDAGKDAVYSLLQQRNAKIDAANGSLDQYKFDKTYNDAMSYIDQKENDRFYQIWPEKLNQQGKGEIIQGSQTAGGVTPSANYDLSEQIKAQFAAQTEAELANLKAAYEKSMRGYEDTAKQLPKTYGAAKNSVAAQNAIAKKNFAERAAASGLNSGTSGQADLALSSAYLSEIAGLEEAQAGAQSDIELQKADLQTEYERAIAAAKATGATELANALHNEQLRVQNLQREDAQIEAAGLGDLRVQKPAQEVAAATPAAGTPGVKLTRYDNGGRTMQEVMQMQQALVNAGANIAVDGKWGPESSAAANGLTADEAWTQMSNPTSVPMIDGKTLAEYDLAASNYQDVKAMCEEVLRRDGREAVLNMLRDAKASGTLNTMDYMSLYNKYRG